ncbi:hypothetical protein Tcan_13906 [Toxocara canis]|uniref:Uncharacterized protein n=1 Tax=Toxocara canis TaxID=6265 RepID=A0A0B2UZE3_TOXCA|nr:hypothetical protein Tcan_13906 [Toxocara canis]
MSSRTPLLISAVLLSRSFMCKNLTSNCTDNEFVVITSLDTILTAYLTSNSKWNADDKRKHFRNSITVLDQYNQYKSTENRNICGYTKREAGSLLEALIPKRAHLNIKLNSKHPKLHRSPENCQSTISVLLV